MKDKEAFQLSAVEMGADPKNKDDYEERLEALQTSVLRVQETYFHEKRRAIVVFEGWDAAGKGGVIRRLTDHLDPRGFKVWPIAAPRADEQERHYLYRFWAKLPEIGTIAIFDRSWYGRVMVERVEGFAREDEWKRAYNEINQFEKMLADDGVRIIKFFLHITPEEQLKRFAQRLGDPFKRWKLTEEDLRNRSRWSDYVAAIEEMIQKTSTDHAPWVAIGANRKWSTRLSVLGKIVEYLSEGVSLDPPEIDPKMQIAALEQLGLPLEYVLSLSEKDKNKDKDKDKKKK